MNDVEIRPPDDAARPTSHSIVLKNTLFLIVAQALGMPLSILVNAVMARHLGVRDFGFIYLAGMMAGLGSLVVEGGQSGTLPSMVARDRRQSGELLGSGLAWRAFATPFVYMILALAGRMLGYGSDLQWALALVVLANTIYTVTAAVTDTVMGFERADVRAYSVVGLQLVTALLVIPTLLLGGQLRATLGVLALASLLVCVPVVLSARSVGVTALRVRRDSLERLLKDGAPFLFTALAVALQPNVDVIFLARLSTPEAMGWLAAARKLVGVLVFPAASLVSALYPTLCRLHAEDADAFRRSTSGALCTATILVVPIALGCGLYADIGIDIFGHSAFGPAGDDLRVLSVFVLLVYFSMTLGTAVAAAGLQKRWALVQLGGVVISAVIDPVLIPWFARHSGNGSLGVCVATVFSEFLTVIAGLVVAPRGIVTPPLLRGIGKALVAGVGMVVVARVLSGVNSFLAAPVAVAAYAGVLWAIGGLDSEQMNAIRAIVSRKARRQNA